MTESRLKLPFDELRTLYMRHLLLQELGLIKEVSLYALSLEFVQRREKTLSLVDNHRNYTELNKCWLELSELESRHVAATVAYQYAICASALLTTTRRQKCNLYENAYQLLIQSGSTPNQRYYLAMLFKKTYWQRHNPAKAMRLLESAASTGHEKALIHLGDYYTRNAKESYDTDSYYRKAIAYYTQAIGLASTEAMVKLALVLENFPSLQEQSSLRFLDLYRRAALKGNEYALLQCEK